MSIAKSFQFQLISPEKELMDAKIVEAVLPGQEGDLAALADHAPLIVQLRPGIATISNSAAPQEVKPGANADFRAGSQQFYLRGGFADIGPDKTIVLAEYAVPLADFGEAELREEIDQAQKIYQDIGEAGNFEDRLAAQDRLERLHSLQNQLFAR